MAERWDDRKNLTNRATHGIGFERFDDMDPASMLVGEATREDYGETRWIYFGLIDGRLYQAVVTFRGGVERVISLRPASRKERRTYAEIHTR